MNKERKKKEFVKSFEKATLYNEMYRKGADKCHIYYLSLIHIYIALVAELENEKLKYPWRSIGETQIQATFTVSNFRYRAGL